MHTLFLLSWRIGRLASDRLVSAHFLEPDALSEWDHFRRWRQPANLPNNFVVPLAVDVCREDPQAWKLDIHQFKTFKTSGT
jgi:hypothetical protein